MMEMDLLTSIGVEKAQILSVEWVQMISLSVRRELHISKKAFIVLLSRAMMDLGFLWMVN